MALNPLHDTSNNQGTKIRYCSKIELCCGLCFTILSCFVALMFFVKNQRAKIWQTTPFLWSNFSASLCSLGWSSGATLKPGNRKPETGNRKLESENQNPESGIRNPESGIRNLQIKENKLFKFANYFCRAFACKKIRGQARKTLKLTFFETKILRLLKFVQPLFVVRVMIMRI